VPATQTNTSKTDARSCCTATRVRPKDIKSFASLFKVLGDETRLEILGMLAAAKGELCVCHIEAQVKHLSQPTISHHLRLLREEGLVKAQRRGTWVYYELDASLAERLRTVLTRVE
jgi:ArsR family transcriptional regulator